MRKYPIKIRMRYYACHRDDNHVRVHIKRILGIPLKVLIAHYNRHGFYTHYFESAGGTIKFLNQFDEDVNPNGLCAEYSMASWLKGECADINIAMREVAGRYIHGIIAMATEWQHRADLKHARRLAARHGYALTAA